MYLTSASDIGSTEITFLDNYSKEYIFWRLLVGVKLSSEFSPVFWIDADFDYSVLKNLRETRRKIQTQGWNGCINWTLLIQWILTPTWKWNSFQVGENLVPWENLCSFIMVHVTQHVLLTLRNVVLYFILVSPVVTMDNTSGRFNRLGHICYERDDQWSEY